MRRFFFNGGNVRMLAVAAIIAVVSGGTVAVAAQMITSKNIKNNTIKPKDLNKNLRKKINRTKVAAGIPGSTGPRGPQGDTGAKGDTGASGQGSTGINSPLIFGPYETPVVGDSGVCGNDWANDTFTRTYIVTPGSDGSFNVTELLKGTFVTIAGQSPGSTDCAGSTQQVAAGITGQFYGLYANTVNTPADPVGKDFNFTATCPTGCNASQFYKAFFDMNSLPAQYSWQFHYTTTSHGSWDNTDHGNTGNIL